MARWQKRAWWAVDCGHQSTRAPGQSAEMAEGQSTATLFAGGPAVRQIPDAPPQPKEGRRAAEAAAAVTQSSLQPLSIKRVTLTCAPRSFPPTTSSHSVLALVPFWRRALNFVVSLDQLLLLSCSFCLKPSCRPAHDSSDSSQTSAPLARCRSEIGAHRTSHNPQVSAFCFFDSHLESSRAIVHLNALELFSLIAAGRKA